VKRWSFIRGTSQIHFAFTKNPNSPLKKPWYKKQEIEATHG
jgi:hypothetical protein